MLLPQIPMTLQDGDIINIDVTVYLNVCAIFSSVAGTYLPSSYRCSVLKRSIIK
jgi:methionine aminopeptidase